MIQTTALFIDKEQSLTIPSNGILNVTGDIMVGTDTTLNINGDLGGVIEDLTLKSGAHMTLDWTNNLFRPTEETKKVPVVVSGNIKLEDPTGAGAKLTKMTWISGEEVPLTLLVSGDAIIGGTLDVDAFVLNANNIQFGNEGSIVADDKAAWTSSSRTGKKGGGPGGGRSTGKPAATTDEYAGGGGHSGIGGSQSTNEEGQWQYKAGVDNSDNGQGAAYGDFKAPTRWGNQGGWLKDNDPTNGGGFIKLLAKTSIHFSYYNVVSSNGGNGNCCDLNIGEKIDVFSPSQESGSHGYKSAGSAGGSIWIEAPKITGSAKLHANGGHGFKYGEPSGGCGSGAGGGGGRIAVYSKSGIIGNSFQITAFGGEIRSLRVRESKYPGCYNQLPSEWKMLAGGSGTIFVVDPNRPEGELIIDNGNTGEMSIDYLAIPGGASSTSLLSSGQQTTPIFGISTKLSALTTEKNSRTLLRIDTTELDSTDVESISIDCSDDMKINGELIRMHQMEYI